MMRRFAGLAFLLPGLLTCVTVLAGCGPDRSTPIQATRTLQQQVESRNWTDLYYGLDPDWRKDLDERVQAAYAMAKNRLPEEKTKNRLELATMEPEERFRVVMEGLAKNERFAPHLEAFVRANPERTTTDGDTASVQLSGVELPLNGLTFHRRDGEWFLRDVGLDQREDVLR